MYQEQAELFYEEAKRSLQGGQYAHALELLEQGLRLDPESVSLHSLRGVALSQSDLPESAAESFREAIRLAPDDPKPRYNLALHLMFQGRRDDAEAELRETLRRQPAHPPSHELLSQIERQRTAPKAQAVPESLPPMPKAPPIVRRPTGPTAPPVQPGAPPVVTAASTSETLHALYALQGSTFNAVHSLPMIERMGERWAWIGWALTWLSTLFFAFVVALNSSKLLSTDFNFGEALQSATLGAGIQVLLGLLSTFYVLLDCLDRRRGHSWVIGLLLSTSCSLGWLSLLLYMMFGRKR